MTCEEIIRIVDNTRTNKAPAELKLSWINTLDRKINNELMQGDFTVHTLTDNVLADDPDIYVIYLLAQLDFYIGEFDRYNNEYLRFAQAYQDYGATYMRNQGAKTPKIDW